MEIEQFVVVTDDPEFCLGTTLLYIDTRNTFLNGNEKRKACIIQRENWINYKFDDDAYCWLPL